MSDRQVSRQEALFPLLVSGVLILALALLIIIKLQLQTRLFISTFDHLQFYLVLGVVLLLTLVWLITLWVQNRSLYLGSLYPLLKWFIFFIFYPPARLVSIVCGIRREAVQSSFLTFQNELFLSNVYLDGSAKLLLLLPHCLQFHDCKIRITRDIDDCVECGRCNISSLKQLAHRYKLKVGIANGGTLARKLVHDNHPDAILAVACHRDLTDGVRESWRYPVYAMLNERPNGPCYDTQVSAAETENIIKALLSRTRQEKSRGHKGIEL